VKVAFLLSAPVLWLPLVAKPPLQPPEAVQEVALVEDHVKVAEPPTPTVVVDAWSDAVGAGTGAEPPPPPPPQAQSTHTAPNTVNDAMDCAIFRMTSRSELLSANRMS